MVKEHGPSNFKADPGPACAEIADPNKHPKARNAAVSLREMDFINGIPLIRCWWVNLGGDELEIARSRFPLFATEFPSG